MELSFFCQTLGLEVEEDEEGMVVVAGWEEGSAAAEHPSLMVRVTSRAAPLYEHSWEACGCTPYTYYGGCIRIIQ